MLSSHRCFSLSLLSESNDKNIFFKMIHDEYQQKLKCTGKPMGKDMSFTIKVYMYLLLAKFP